MIAALAAFYASHSQLINQVGTNALLALSLSICLMAGQLALAQAAFMGIGAYASAIAALSWGWGLPASAALAIVCAAIAGGLLALPVRRLRGVFLAIATVGFGEMVRVLANNLSITGGAEGLASIPNDANTWWVYGALLVVAIGFFVLQRSKYGLAIAVSREDETAARGVGIDVAQVRFATLVAGGAIAGLAGALYAHGNFFITPSDFAFGRMEEILVFCVIGGATSPIGAVIGATALTILPEVIRFLHDFREVVDGAILLAVVIFAPRGIAGLWQRS